MQLHVHVDIYVLCFATSSEAACGVSRGNLPLTTPPPPPRPPLLSSNVVRIKHAMLIVHSSMQVCSQQWCQLSAAIISHPEGTPECPLVKARGIGGQNRPSRLWSSCQMATASALQSRTTLLGVQQHPAAMPYLALLTQLCQTGQQLCHAYRVTASFSQIAMLPVH